jgi:predicted TIM-barrel fold metal-dependent hydrolase
LRINALSADSHINEPPDLFVKRVPAHLRERAPHVINLDNGGEAWVFEDVPEPVPLGLTAVNFRAQKRFDRSNYKEKFLEYRDGVQRGVRFEDILPGSWDAVARLGEQDEDHVQAEVLYQGPTVWAGVKASGDPELRLACFRAYNDWMAEFSAVAPDRLVGVGLVPDTGIDDAVAELHRCVDLGLRSVALESYPNGSWTEITTDDDRFWAAAVERDTVVDLHATFSFPPNSTRLFAQGDSSLGALSAVGAFEKVAERMIVTGVFDRHPTLRFVGAEVNCGWLPYWLEQFDVSYRRHGKQVGVSLDLLPSEYFRRNVYVTFIIDPVGVQARHLIGMANLMWCSDFPHSVSNWPIDVEIAHAQMVDCNQAEIDRMMWRTAADLYGIPYDEPTDQVLEGATA